MVFCVLSLGSAAFRPCKAQSPDEGDGAHLLNLLMLTQSQDSAAVIEPSTLPMGPTGQDSTSPLLPFSEFLLAEVHLLQGDTATAYGHYVDIARSAFSPDDGDVPPASSLALVSLLRALYLVRAEDDRDGEKVKRLIELSLPMAAKITARSMLELPVLGGLPKLEEDLLRELAYLAWESGDRNAAASVFLRYLKIGSAFELDPVGTEIADYLVSSGVGSRDELALIRGKRLYRLRDYENAGSLLKEALGAELPDTRAEAGYYLARTRSIQGATRREIITLLTEALEDATRQGLVQELLYYRATVFNREGKERDIERFARDLGDILERFPTGSMADDALYALADHHNSEGNTNQALSYLARLREHPGPNDWLESSYFRAAIILYSRAEEGDMASAGGLLDDLIAFNPKSQLGLASRFWLGRIAEEQGDSAEARRHYETVTAICPYDYYALRARMHLNIGAGAVREAWADSLTEDELRRSFRAAAGSTRTVVPRIAHDRLRLSLTSGFYKAVLEADRHLRMVPPEKKQTDLHLEDLDGRGPFATMNLLLALRKDAVEAAAKGPGGVDRLAVAFSVGEIAGDWPLAMLLVFGLDRSVGTQSVIQQDPLYMEVAYPPVHVELIAEAGDAYNVPPELLYAVIRRESLFYPAAVSRVGAMGLFQFMPYTFETLNGRWNVLAGSGTASMAAFLRHPDLTIDLGARWFRQELLDRNRGNILHAVMEHNAGYSAVDTWREAWEEAGRIDDIEYMIETAGFTETRIFARSVLTDMVMARTLGLFDRYLEDPAQ
jgi:soluble lytic murein transglycosylase-like protein